MSGLCFEAISFKPCARFVQGGAAGYLTVDFTFSGGVLLQRRIDLALRGACGIACGDLCCGSGFEFSVCRFKRLTFCGSIEARLFKFGFDID